MRRPDPPAAPDLATWLHSLRPQLHRYCARMTGSVFDGEDAVQEALVNALESFPGFDALEHPQAWLFRVAHNAAMDVLRARARLDSIGDEDEMKQIADPASPIEERSAARAALTTFMRIAPAQRSSVILADVLGYSLDEIGTITGRSVFAVKASLHRGRERLRAIGSDDETPERALPALNPAERDLLAGYVERFNARDFDAVRDMLAEEVRLDLVARRRLNGKSAVGTYLTNYASVHDWQFVPGFVEGRLAAIVCEPGAGLAQPLYCVLLGWRNGALARIRDFRYARYVIESADLRSLTGRRD